MSKVPSNNSTRLTENSKRPIDEILSGQKRAKIQKVEVTIEASTSKNSKLKKEVIKSNQLKDLVEATSSSLQKLSYSPETDSPSYAVIWSLFDLMEKRYNNAKPQSRYLTPSEIYNHGNQYYKKPLKSTYYSQPGDDAITELSGLGWNGWRSNFKIMLKDDDGKYTLTNDMIRRCLELEKQGERPKNTKQITKKPKNYKPRFRSGSYAIMKYLLDVYPIKKTKTQICRGAQHYANARFYSDGIDSLHDGSFSRQWGWNEKPQFNAWDNIYTLIEKLLVLSNHDDDNEEFFNGCKWGLSEEGFQLASQL